MEAPNLRKETAKVKFGLCQGPSPLRTPLSPRAYYKSTTSEAWQLYWEAGPYYERIAEALEGAHSYAVFVGWQIDSRIELSLSRREEFRELVVRLCNEKPDFHIYFLMWDYAYFYVFEREILQGWVWDNIHERVHFVFDNRHPYGGSHHEKLVIIDGETSFVGGVDICDHRWDWPTHNYLDDRRSLHHDGEGHLPYHDLIVEVKGEVSADLVEYVAERWSAVSSIPFPLRQRVARSEGRGKYTILLSRTRAKVGVGKPLLIRETEFLFRDMIRSAKNQIVIENQYYWSRTINEVLIAKLRERAGTGFKLFIVVPSGYGGSLAFRVMGLEQTKLLDKLEKVAKETGAHFILGCPFVRDDSNSSEKSIYVHSKVIVVDDRIMTLGSSNFNNRGFRLDTEIALTLVGDTEEVREEIRGVTRKIVAHWGDRAYDDWFETGCAGDSKAANQRKIYLKSYHRSWDHYFRSIEGRIALTFPLIGKAFDPSIPFGFALKSRLAIGNLVRLQRSVPVFLWGGLLMMLGCALLLLSAVQRLLDVTWMVPHQGHLLYWAVTLVFILSCSWILPFPTFLISIFAGLILGSKPAAIVVFSSLVVASNAGYWFARIFPELATRYYQKIAPHGIAETLGLRRLPIVIHVVLNPRLNFISKIAYQGIFSIPARWFIWSSLILAVINSAAAYLSGFFNPI